MRAFAILAALWLAGCPDFDSLDSPDGDAGTVGPADGGSDAGTPVCTPTATRCRDALHRETCAADGSGWTSTACPTDATCSAGECRGGPVCDALSTDCLDATTRRVCRGDGSGWDDSACPAGSTCNDGVCTSNECSAPKRMCRGSCVADVTHETCSGEDSDCDGLVEEGCHDGKCVDPDHVLPEGGTFHAVLTSYSSMRGACGAGSAGSGYEHVFHWTPAKNGNATFKVTAAYSSLQVHVHAGSCSGTEVACDVASGSTPTVSLTVPVTGGLSYDLVVDSDGARTGDAFVVTVTPP